MQNKIEMVREFHTTFRQAAPRGFTDAKDATAELRFKLIEEEYKEWQAATPMSHELLDALVDLEYVVAGSFVGLGLAFEDPHRTYSLVLTNRKNPIDHYVAMALSALVVRPLCPRRLTDSLSDLLAWLDYCGRLNGFDMDTAFNIVHKANMSKLWKTHQLTPLNKPADLGGTYMVNAIDGTVLVHNKAGKVLKPPGFVPPDLTPVLTAALRLFEPPAAAARSSPAPVVETASPAPAPAAPPAPLESAPQSRSRKVVVRTSAKKS